jgi:hypothetical protein
MSQLDSEINAVRARLNALEEQKQLEEKLALEKKKFPLKTLEDIIIDKRMQIQNNRYSKNVPLARFYDVEKIGYLEPILDALKNIQERLNALEKKELQGTLLSNLVEE